MCGMIFPYFGRSESGDPKNESTGSKMVRIMSYKVVEGEDLMVEERIRRLTNHCGLVCG